MTLVDRPVHKTPARFSWVPAAAGWTVGVIATLSLLAYRLTMRRAVRWLS